MSSISMSNTSYGRCALRKFGAVPEGFEIFYSEWLDAEKPGAWTRMRVKGAVFKGRRRVPRTTMETILTSEEIIKEGK
jgi:uncharacterized membrane-anchored protein